MKVTVVRSVDRRFGGFGKIVFFEELKQYKEKRKPKVNWWEGVETSLGKGGKQEISSVDLHMIDA